MSSCSRTPRLSGEATSPVDVQECLLLDSELEQLIAELTSSAFSLSECTPAHEDLRATTPLLITRQTRSGICFESVDPQDPEKICGNVMKRLSQLPYDSGRRKASLAARSSAASATTFAPVLVRQSGGPSSQRYVSLPLVPTVSKEDFEDLPLHHRTVVELRKLNEAIDQINDLLRKKYSKPRARTETAEFRKAFWFSEAELVSSGSVFKLRRQGLGIISILRFMGFISSRSEGREKRYVVCCSNYRHASGGGHDLSFP